MSLQVPVADKDGAWWPWASKKMALSDIMAGFPRAVYSEAEMDSTRWFAENFGVKGLLSSKQVKYSREKILKALGYTHVLQKSAMGNLYAELDLRSIIADVSA